jgi:hypothetical protein
VLKSARFLPWDHPESDAGSGPMALYCDLKKWILFNSFQLVDDQSVVHQYSVPEEVGILCV